MMNITFSILALCLIHAPVMALEKPIKELLKEVRDINKAPCENCSQGNLPPVEPIEKKARCMDNMESIYADGLAEIDIFLGYYDSAPRNAMVNPLEKASIIETLTARCGEKSQLCGFKQSPDDSSKFSKTTKKNGIDQKVVISLYDAALNGKNSRNKNPEQEKLSADTEKKFHERLKVGEAVFYVGHSRYGGGPDFSPPVLKWNRHIDSEYYLDQKKGVKLMVDGLTDSKIKIFGSFSCDSINHYSKEILKASPDLVFFGTTRIPSYEENINSFLLALGKVINQKCDFNADTKKSDKPSKMIDI